MYDQAEGLRLLARQMLRKARVIAITSGKGGVGKTNIAANLGISLAEMGRRVIVIDADLGLANVDVLLDITPRYNISHVVSGEKEMVDILVRGPGGMWLVPGASGIWKLANLAEREMEMLIAGCERLEREADFILLDTSAGISRTTMDFVCSADEVIVVTTPEPTSVTDAYAVIKILAQNERPPSLNLIVNMAANSIEAAKVADGIGSVVGRFLNVYVEKLGYVLSDPYVPASVRHRKAFVLEFPKSHASYCVKNLAYALSNSIPAGGGHSPGFFRKFFKRIFG